jgi:flavin-dependent dehydrogenase
MKHHPVIIVGGGPAGASCAWHLGRSGVQALVLDRAQFPRPKLCAGWITPQVLADLELDPEDYPGSLSVYPALRIFLKGIPIRRPGRQYAVRRVEFDHWLLKRSGADLIQHQVKKIRSEAGGFILDDKYSCDVLIGAGGTHCPVYHQLFKKNVPRSGARIAALEVEFKTDWTDPRPQLRFFDHGLPGYSWYLPKKDGWINLGVGGNVQVMKERKQSIQFHWDRLLDTLEKSRLVNDRIPEPDGHVYYLQGPGLPLQNDKAYLVGDAAGLATLDMGEGIGPAVLSGIRAAESVLVGQPYKLDDLERVSLLPGWLGRFFG